jgi:hypothetical protein
MSRPWLNHDHLGPGEIGILADFLAHLVAALQRQHDIEQDEIGAEVLGQPERRFAVADRLPS